MDALKKRTGFRYNSDADEVLDQAADQGMDEQEQENLISSLSQQDETTTAFYRKVFLALPAACLLYFAIATIMQPRAGGSSTVTFFSLLSLLLSLGAAYRIPVSAATQTQNTNAAGVFSELGMRLPAGWEGVADKVLDNLVLLNAAVCIVLCIAAVAFTDTDDAEGIGSVNYSVVPVLRRWLVLVIQHYNRFSTNVSAVCFVIVAVAKRELRPVDIPSLERLKYIYKGA